MVKTLNVCAVPLTTSNGSRKEPQMPRFGVRSVVTYALVGGVLAATFVGVEAGDRANLDNLAALAVGFFFAREATKNGGNGPTGGASA